MAKLRGAPYGWTVEGADGRRIDRFLSHPAAEELKARIENTTGEKLKMFATKEAPILSVVQSPDPADVVDGDPPDGGVDADLVEGNVDAVKERIEASDLEGLDAFVAAEKAQEHPRSTVLDLVEKRRAELS